MVFVCVVGDERGVVYSCPVARMVGTLASTSPCAAALKRGPSGILCNGLHADIFEQKVFPRGLQLWLLLNLHQIRTRLHVRINLYLV